MNLIELRDARKTYRQGGPWGGGREVRAVDGVTLSIAAGRCLAVVGPSGSGKSTLGRLVLGLERPDSGEMLYRGRQFHRLRGRERTAARRNIQVVFQNSHGAVNPRFSAKDIIGEPLRNFDRLEGDALTNRVEGLMESVGLQASDMSKLPHQFSGGELQRICLARALAPQPELIVLDEALSSLDMVNQSRILDLIAGIRDVQGTAFLFISHDLRLVLRLADSIAVIRNGKLTAHAETMSEMQGVINDATFSELVRAALPCDPRPEQ